MSGGVYRLIVNDGIQDKLLMATEYLARRIKEMKANRLKSTNNTGYLNMDDSWSPSVDMISKTHVIFTNGAFKPFVAAGFEYNKVNSSASLGKITKFTLPQFGDFVNDAVLHIRLTGLRAKSYLDRVRYVSFLGHKLISKVSFTVNGNPLDEYTTDNYNAYYQFHVEPKKRIGWLRNVGQEIPNCAQLTPDPSLDLFREYRWFGDGNQTFKQSHDAVELWVPLLFWFREIHNALPNGAIPFGQTDISVTFAQASDIVGFADYGGGGDYDKPTISSCELYINNIFMNPEVSNIFIKNFGFSLIRVHNKHTKSLTMNDGELRLNELKWPTECLYVAFKPRSNLSLSQEWHLSSTLELCEIKVPVAARNDSLTTIGAVDTSILQPTKNTASISYVSGPLLQPIDDFYVNYEFIITGGAGFTNDIRKNRYIITKYISATNTITIDREWPIGIMPDNTTTFQLFTHQIAINMARYYKELPTIDTLEVKASGIVIFTESSESFFNSYLPYRYGKNMNTPSDRGWYMINFNFFPGEHQPSGHINLSRAREFYLKYKNTFNANISELNRVELIVLADTINFLLVKDGSAVLRYST